jgi:citrate lyase subunit beta/citryl-CoA lyase
MEFDLKVNSSSIVGSNCLMRSKLFVPGSRPSLFDKAALGPADVLSFDLEDSVLPDKKSEARAAVAGFLRQDSTVRNKIMIARVNEPGSEWFHSDIAMLVGPGLDIINLPKVESVDQINMAVDEISRIERSQGLTKETGILANIETPKGLRLAFEIATANPRVMGLQIGFTDFSRICGIDSRDKTALNSVRLSVRFAAAEAGIATFDGAFLDVNSPDLFRIDAEEARNFGFVGKSCIHPTQVPIANEVFSPDAGEVARAESILAAAAEKMQAGVGAFLHEGKMIDAPVISRAKSLVSRATAVREHSTK